MNDQKSEISLPGKTTQSEDREKPYVLSKEVNKNILQPSWRAKGREIARGGQAVAGMTPDKKDSVGLRIEQNAEKYADKLALLYEDEKYTHKEFNEWINRYANYFLKLDLKKGDVAVVFLENRPEVLFAICALGKIGAISSLVNTNLRESSLIHSMKHTPGKIYLIGEELLQAFEDVKSRLELTVEQKRGLYYLPDEYLPDERKVDLPGGYLNFKEEIKDSSTKNPPTTPEILAGDQYAYIFTSGTTGLPKAAIIKHKSTLIPMIWWGQIVCDMKTEDIIYVTTPLFHSHGIRVAFAAALYNGSALAIARKFSASKFWDDTRKFNATMFNYVGEICRYLYNQPPKPDDADNPIKKIVGNGLRNDIWLDFKKRFNISEVREFYGATEDTFPNFANVHNVDKTCGICFSPYAIVKYDIEADEPIKNEKGFMIKVKPGEVGLLLAQVPEPDQFYMYKDKEANESKVFHNVLKEGDMYVNTGDLLRDIGYQHVQFVDRLGDTFRWKGENVSTEEVETVINSFEQTEMCSVYGVLIPNTEGRAGIVSIIKKADDKFDLKKFLPFAQKYLPKYAVPKFIRFKDQFEFTATHKILKVSMKKEGYDINRVSNSMFVLLPNSSEYVPLNKEIYDGISKGKYNF